MDNKKDDNYYVSLIVRDCDFIENNILGVSLDAFENDELLQCACSFKLVQISENAKKLSDKYREEQDNIVWHVIYGLRNRIVHEYGAVDLQHVYETLTIDIPDLSKKLLSADPGMTERNN